MSRPRVVIRANAIAKLTHAVERATVRALNRAITAVEVSVGRELARATGIPVTPVRRRLTIEKAQAGKLVAQLRVSGRPFGLIYFRARQTRAGVTHTARGARTLERHAFIAKMANRYRGVFRRQGKKRLKILRQDGPPLTAAPGIDDILERGLAVGEATFQKRLQHELGRELGGGS